MKTWLESLLAVTGVGAVLVKATLLMGSVWLAHLVLAGHNRRWRVLLWRVAMLGLLALVPAEFLLPKLRLAVIEPPPAVTVRLASVTPRIIEKDAPHSSVMVRQPVADSVDEASPATASVPRSPSPVPAPPAGISARSEPAREAAMRIWLRHHWQSLLDLGWILGVLTLTIRLAFFRRRLARVLSESRPAPAWLQDTARRVADQLRLRKVPKFHVSAGLMSPFAAGLFKPVVVIPELLLAAERAAVLPPILAHELSHFQTRDLLWMFLARCLAIVAWFHPLAWQMRAAHDLACEEVADGVAASLGGGARAYSSALASAFLELVVDRAAPVGVSLLRRGEITRRIQTLRRGLQTVAPA